MRMQVFQHVPFEDAAHIAIWAAAQGVEVAPRHLYAGEAPLPVERYDWLTVMGGPMGIYDEERYPWLAAEKVAIREAIAAGKVVLGICLGAQLIADVLGGPVSRNPAREIGWFPVALTPMGRRSPLFAGWPAEFPAFHWHGDTFALPTGSLPIASSQTCHHQAFSYTDRVVGLQFHLESTPASVRRLVDACQDDLTPGPWVQTPGALLTADAPYAAGHGLLERLLARLAERVG
jgi:GMP synthase-like glutamine amidotransferase